MYKVQRDEWSIVDTRVPSYRWCWISNCWLVVGQTHILMPVRRTWWTYRTQLSTVPYQPQPKTTPRRRYWRQPYDHPPIIRISGTRCENANDCCHTIKTRGDFSWRETGDDVMTFDRCQVVFGFWQQYVVPVVGHFFQYDVTVSWTKGNANDVEGYKNLTRHQRRYSIQRQFNNFDIPLG